MSGDTFEAIKVYVTFGLWLERLVILGKMKGRHQLFGNVGYKNLLFLFGGYTTVEIYPHHYDYLTETADVMLYDVATGQLKKLNRTLSKAISRPSVIRIPSKMVGGSKIYPWTFFNCHSMKYKSTLASDYSILIWFRFLTNKGFLLPSHAFSANTCFFQPTSMLFSANQCFVQLTKAFSRLNMLFPDKISFISRLMLFLPTNAFLAYTCFFSF